jgi:tetratricopeptide (TPR) repeat protein
MKAMRMTSVLLSAMMFCASTCGAQSESTEKMKAFVTPRNDYVVSVQELRMSGKAKKAFEQGARLLQKGETARSLAYFDQAIAEFPGHYKAYYDRGIAQYRLGHAAEAEEAFQKSIDLTGGAYAPPQFAMGMVLCQEQQLQKAEAVIQRGLDVDPGSATGKYFLGWAQFGLNHLIEAERSLQQALVRKANFAEAYFLLARIHQRQHNAPAMTRDLEAYLKLEHNSVGSQQAKALLDSAQQDAKQSGDATLAFSERQ